jgi:hypothetical protein
MKDTDGTEEKLDDQDRIDPELSSLPTPPKKRRRNPWIMLLVILIGCFMLYWLRTDLAYFFRSETPLELGDVTDIDLAKVESNSYVHISGIPNPTKVVKFTKRLSKGFFRLFPLVGTTDVFVQLHVREDSAEEKAKKEKKKTDELPGEFTGRAIRFADLEKTGIASSSYKNIRDFFFEKFYMTVPEGSMLIMDGDNPKSYWVYPLLAAFICLFVVLNTALLIRYIVSRAKRKKE